MKWTRMLALVATLAVGMTVTACGDDPVEPDPPGVPSSVTVSVDGTTINVSWIAVANAHSYRVTLSEGNATVDTETTTATTASFTGLTQGATYAVLVTAINDDGEVSADPRTATIPAPDAPPAPEGVAIDVDGTTATVSWDASEGADDYRVVLTDGAGNETSAVTAETTATFEDLAQGATYAVTVTARNDAGGATSSARTFSIESNVVQVTGDILENTTWTSDKIWVLNQPTFVGQDCGPDGGGDGCTAVTLTIEPGTTVLGKTDIPQGVRGAYLVVSRGSRLVADATNGEDRKPTADEVIVFTSDKPRGQRARGDWGGLVINGQAPTNAGDEATGEGDSGLFGGPDVNDDSGILRGVRIEYAGDRVTPSDELNGIALQGVGAGTTISYIQVHYNTDDGIEPFGGTVSVDHGVFTGIGDDSVDGTDGYRGFMQFLVIQQRADEADQGFEISTSGEETLVEPFSTAVIANATAIGAKQTGEISALGGGSDDGIQYREGTNYRVYNSIVVGFEAGLNISGAQAQLNASNRMAGQSDPDATLSGEGLILFNNGTAFTDATAQAFFETAGFNNMVADPNLDASAYNIGSMANPPNVIPSEMPAGYTAATLPAGFDDNLVEPLDGRTLMQTTYAGAVEPGTALADAWYTGWTIWTEGGDDSRPNDEGL